MAESAVSLVLQSPSTNRRHYADTLCCQRLLILRLLCELWKGDACQKVWSMPGVACHSQTECEILRQQLFWEGQCSPSPKAELGQRSTEIDA